MTEEGHDQTYCWLFALQFSFACYRRIQIICLKEFISNLFRILSIKSPLPFKEGTFITDTMM